MNDIFLRLSEAAKALGANGNSDIARLINESPQAITNWAKRGVPAKKIFSIAKSLRVTPEWLQFGNESRVPANLVSLHGGGLPVPNSAPNDLVAQDSDEEMMLRFLRMMTDEQRQETLNSAKKVYDHNQEIMEKLSSRKRA